MEEKIAKALKIIEDAVDKFKPIAVYGLTSGGHDSLTVLGIAARHPRFTSAVHINTGFGIEDTRIFVRETCAREGWALKEYEAMKNTRADGTPDPMDYRELVRKYGFPGPPGHGLMYNRLKERPLRMLMRDTKKGHPRRSHVLLITGCRSQESTRRMGNTAPVDKRGSSVWLNPIHDWSKVECNQFIDYMGYPRNPVSDLIHKSGECLCVDENTLVRSVQGWRPIVDVKVGDKVLTSGLHEHKVLKVHRNGVQPVVRLKPYFLPELIATLNHPVQVVPYEFTGKRGAKVIGSPQWLEVGDVFDAFVRNKGKSVCKQKKHYVVRPFSDAETALRLSSDQLRFLGYFMSEGCYNWRKDAYHDGPGGVVFTVSGTDPRSIEMAADIERLLTTLFRTAHRREWVDKRTGRQFITVRNMRKSSSDFAQRFITGRYCTEKFFNEDVMSATLQQQRELLESMWIGDGSEFVRKRDGEAVSAYGTSSPTLALQVQELLLRQGKVYGINTAPSKSSPSGKSYLVRRSSNQALRYGYLESSTLFTGIQSVEAVAARPVMNLSVAQNHTFLTPSGLVHNCGAFAKPGELAELRLWFPKMAEEIDALYEEVKGKFPWGWEGRPERGERKVKQSGPLCTSCDKQADDDGLFDGDIVVTCQTPPKG